MKMRRLFTFAVSLALGPLCGWAQLSDLATPKKREETVALSEKLLRPRAFVVQPAEAISPFAPPAFTQPEPEELRARQAATAAGITPRLVGDRAVLERLASFIVPSGTLRLGSQAILLFGQKKLKVGDRLTITFEETNYDLDITAIGTTDFTLRYNGEEITRSIKPGSQP